MLILVVLNPLSDMIELSCSNGFDAVGILGVFFSEIVVMGTIFDDKGDVVVSDVGENTTSTPWVKFTVGEDDIG